MDRLSESYLSRLSRPVGLTMSSLSESSQERGTRPRVCKHVGSLEAYSSLHHIVVLAIDISYFEHMSSTTSGMVYRLASLAFIGKLRAEPGSTPGTGNHAFNRSFCFCGMVEALSGMFGAHQTILVDLFLRIINDSVRKTNLGNAFQASGVAIRRVPAARTYSVCSSIIRVEFGPGLPQLRIMIC
jgi:hypothetical protein